MSSSLTTDKVCIHRYLMHCLTNNQPPGFGDFLRGCITLFKYSKLYNYTFYIDYKSNPVFSYFKDSKFYIKDTSIDQTHEILPSGKIDKYNPSLVSIEALFNNMDESIQELFNTGNSFALITNGFYTKYNNKLYNYGPIDLDTKTFLKDILTPTSILDAAVQIALTKLNINTAAPYRVIHLRLGDSYLNRNNYNEGAVNYISSKIMSLVYQNHGTQFILLSDSSLMANAIKGQVPSLFYWDNKKVHIGDLINGTENLLDTLVDFCIMTKAKTIYSICPSGFSTIASLIYDIPIEQLS